MARNRLFWSLVVLVLVGAFAWTRSGTDDGGPDAREHPRAGAPTQRRVVAGNDDTSAPEPGRLRGRLLDRSGAGLGTGRVCVKRAVPSHEVAPRCTDTQADGRFDIPLPPGQYLLGGVAPGYVAAPYGRDDGTTRVALGPMETESGLDIVLDPGSVSVRGQVRDIGGGGIEAAWVTSTPDALLVVRGGVLPVLSGDEGWFEVWAPPKPTTLHASADGYGPGLDRGAVPGHAFEIVLAPESVIRGTLVDAQTEEPLSGTSLRVSVPGVVTLSHDDGTFELRGLAPGVYKPVARGTRRFGEATTAVRLTIGEHVEGVTIRVFRAQRVIATVLEGETPCPRGSVTLTSPSTGLVSTAPLDEHGVVSLDAVMPGTHRVMVVCRGASEVPTPATLRVDTDDLKNVELRLAAAATLSGVTEDEAGNPVARVPITVTAPYAVAGSQTPLSAISDGAGNFAFERLVPGSYTVAALPGYAHYPSGAPQTVRLEGGESSDVRLTLANGGLLNGSVVDPTGAAVADVDVVAVAASGSHQTPADDEGAFVFRGLPPGDYRVYALRGADPLPTPGMSPEDKPGTVVSISAEKQAEVTLVVQPLDQVLSGVVVNHDGAPVPDAYIELQRTPEGAAANHDALTRIGWWGSMVHAPVVSDADGVFEVGGLAPGAYAVRAHHTMFGEALAEGVAPGDTLRLQMRGVTSISGTARAKGPAPEALWVGLDHAQGHASYAERFFRTDGRWQIDGIPVGTYTVRVESVVGDATLPALELQPGNNTVDIELETRGSLSGVVVDLESGKPISGYHVNAETLRAGLMQDDWNSRVRTTDADGAFKLDEVPAGSITVAVWPPNFEDATFDAAIRLARIAPGSHTNLSPLRLVRRRLGPDERPGDLGFLLKEDDPNDISDETPLRVAVVRPDGPAAVAGMQVGDIVVTIDGHDVTRDNRYLSHRLLQVPAGDAVAVGVARDVVLTITAAAP